MYRKKNKSHSLIKNLSCGKPSWEKPSVVGKKSTATRDSKEANQS